MRLTTVICMTALGLTLSMVAAKPKAKPLKVKTRLAVKVNGRTAGNSACPNQFPDACQKEGGKDCNANCPGAKCCEGLVCKDDDHFGAVCKVPDEIIDWPTCKKEGDTGCFLWCGGCQCCKGLSCVPPGLGRCVPAGPTESNSTCPGRFPDACQKEGGKDCFSNCVGAQCCEGLDCYANVCHPKIPKCKMEGETGCKYYCMGCQCCDSLECNIHDHPGGVCKVPEKGSEESTPLPETCKKEFERDCLEDGSICCEGLKCKPVGYLYGICIADPDSCLKEDEVGCVKGKKCCDGLSCMDDGMKGFCKPGCGDKEDCDEDRGQPQCLEGNQVGCNIREPASLTCCPDMDLKCGKLLDESGNDLGICIPLSPLYTP